MRIAYVNIFVSNLVRAVEFYRDALGLDQQAFSPEHQYASFSDGVIKLGIAEVGPEHQELMGRHTGVGLVVVDLNAEYERLAALGVQFTMPPTRQPWGGFMALVADPDGNIFYMDQEPIS